MKTDKQLYDESRILNLSEICWRLLEQWKVVVCFGLVIMALFLGLMHVRYRNQVKSNDASQAKLVEHTPDKLINELPKEEQNDVTYAYRLQQQLMQSEKIIRESLWMNIDPYHARRLQSSWVIISDAKNESTLAEAYLLYLESDEVCQKLLPYYGEGMDLDQIRESIIFDYADEDVSGAFRCELLLYDGVDEEAIQTAFLASVDDVHELIVKQAGDHSISCFDKGIIEGNSEKLATRQEAVSRRSSYINQQLEATTNGFSQEQKEIYEKITAVKNGEQIAQQAVPRSITPRNMLIGFVLGIMAYIGLLILRMIASGKVYSCRDIESSGVHTLGEWYDKKTVNFLSLLFRDQYVYRWHHKNRFDKEKEVRQASKGLVDICDASDKRLLFALTAQLQQEQKGCCDELISACKQKGYVIDIVQVDDQNSILDQYAVSDIAGVVLIIVDSRTKYQFINQTFNQCNYYSVPVYGNFYLG